MNNIRTIFRGTEDGLTLLVFLGLVFIPFIETVTRVMGLTIVPSAPVLVQHLTLWIGFIGAVVATRHGKLLALTTTSIFVPRNRFSLGHWSAQVVSIIVVSALAYGAIDLILVEYRYPINIAPHLPRWTALLIMPVGFVAIAIQMGLKSSKTWKYPISIAVAGISFIMVSRSAFIHDLPIILWVGFGVILIALFFGAPIFVGLGGLALLYFWYDYVPVSSIAAETYRIVVSPSLPTIPLFTLAGYFLAASKASERMMYVFRSLFGWIPGGTPIIVVVLSGFFTALTGGSGVTILALGGILYPILKKEGYSESFSIGLITVAGSVGLLFPPSLPAIVYGVTAGVSVKDVFIGGFIPGILLLVFISGWAVYQEKSQGITRVPFSIRNVLSSIWDAKYEAIIPLLILTGIFSGYMTLVETAALTVIYILVIEILVNREILLKSIPGIILECAALIGGVLIILGVAMGLTSYLVDAQIPYLLSTWVKTAITSKYVFLLALNILLLVVGCLMDIFSAIIVIVPLIAPLGQYFGIHPVHLAVIFIANLELGFLTPPVGMNLFLSAYRFNKSMPELYRATWPFFIVRIIAVLLITYIPIITLWLVL
ncbi:MAG: TRAP transporter large permease subunit [Fidelibacterota bacterium]